MSRLILFFFLLTSPLRISAPPELATVQKKLESIEAKRFADIATTVGLSDLGPPIQVALAPESAAVAREMPSWIAGFASSPDDLIVLFPARTPEYPNGSLEDVLRHEVAHVWIGRAAGGRPIPRWFNEGLAMSVERGWRWRDEGQFMYQWAAGPRSSLEELDRMFGAGAPDVTRAYAMSGALVHDLLQRHGASTGASILANVRTGASFEHAFTVVVGQTPSAAEADFWERQYSWTEWLATLTSSTTLWLGITALALVAILRRIMKNRAIERRWEEEEEEDSHTIN